MARSITSSPVFVAFSVGLVVLVFIWWNLDFVMTLGSHVTLQRIGSMTIGGILVTANKDKTIVQTLTPHSDNLVWVNATGDFKARVSVYNSAIDKYRTTLLQQRNVSTWRELNNATRTVVWCNADDFMYRLDRFAQVKTIVLPWLITPKHHNSQGRYCSLSDTQNLLVQKYFEWTASEPLCAWIKTPGLTKARWDAVYNRTCHSEIALGFVEKSIEPVYFHGKPINPRDYWPHDGLQYPSYFYDHVPDRLLYIHVIQDGVITGVGDVISGNLKLVPYACSQDTGSEPPRNYKNTPIYSEVFVLTQFWGEAFFHKINEVLPRIAPYVEFLTQNPSIKLHAAEEFGLTRAALKFLGFAPERIITGVSRAKVVYLPQATPCGFAHSQELQLLSAMYRERIGKTMSGLERNLVVLIKRSGLRRFKKQPEVAYVVEKTAGKFGYEFAVFADSPTPSMEETMHMFARAVMVVAPHGAGLSNVVYSEPGTIVIEGVCNRPHVNMCYQWSSHILGHRYHGVPSKQGCEDVIDVEPDMIDIVMTSYLSRLKNSLSAT